MAAVSPPAGGGINDVFPTWRKNNIRVCPIISPHRRRRRPGNRGQAGGGTSSTVEQVGDAGAPAGDTSGFDLAS
jgi:hypothetical protein